MRCFEWRIHLVFSYVAKHQGDVVDLFNSNNHITEGVPATFCSCATKGLFSVQVSSVDLLSLHIMFVLTAQWTVRRIKEIFTGTGKAVFLKI